MYRYTVFDIATGEIRRGGICSEEATIWVQAQPGERTLPIKSDAETQYVYGLTLVNRPAVCDGVDVSIPADGVATFVLAGVPAGTVIRFGGDDFRVDDGEFVFSTALPGVWVVEINPPFPFQRQAFKVTANAL